MSASLFAGVALAPRDPILGLNEQFAADPNPAKVNLGVGVYFDDEGKLPVLQCVAAAEKQLLASPKAKGYLPIDGIAAYDKAVQGLVFGAEHPAVKGGRIATAQAIGGTGGLKLGGSAYIRMSAIRNKIPYITTVEAAKAAVEGLEAVRVSEAQARPLQEYHRPP